MAAYLWQNGFDGKAPAQAQGDKTHGKDLFESRGCLACHSIGEEDQKLGGTFAANLFEGRRESQLRLHRALDLQPARTLGALLSERASRSDAGGLFEARPALSVRY